MSNDETLQSSVNFYEYHKEKMNRLASFKNQKGSNIDKLTSIYDATTFQIKKNLDEQDKAHDINQASGLQLDDIGDNYRIERNGLDDNTYRFLLKSHQQSIRSKGTFKDLILITSNLLGCSPTDIQMNNERVLNQNNLDNGGDINTITINKIDITKIKNSNLIPLLSNELQNSAAAGYHVKQVNFFNEINQQLFIGTELRSNARITIPIPQNMTDNLNLAMNTYQDNQMSNAGFLEI